MYGAHCSVLLARCMSGWLGVLMLAGAACWAVPAKSEPAASKPKPRYGPMPKLSDKEDIGVIEIVGAKVVYKDIRPVYAEALIKVAAEARRVYSQKYGFDMPDSVSLMMEKKPKGSTSLWTDGESTMTLTVQSDTKLLPPMLSGVFNIYGMCHELGHMAMYRKVSHMGLPYGVAEAWAHYAGSVVVDEVYRKYGEKLYPVPYNYSEAEGTARMKAQASAPAESAFDKAAKAFCAAHERFGAGRVMGAMRVALDARPAGKDLMPRFVDELVKSTRDESARGLFPEEVTVPKVHWEVKEREVTEKTFEGLKAEEKDGALTLSYDEGESDGFLSDCGSGFAVIYKAPEGKWAMSGVSFFGRRFGSPEPPNEDFSLFICDRDFSVIKEIKKPYGTFDREAPRWYRMDFDPVAVPEVFYVCAYFNANTYKGVYAHKDKDVKRSHSFFAIPYSFVGDVGEEFDWMIRVHLVRAGGQ